MKRTLVQQFTGATVVSKADTAPTLQGSQSAGETAIIQETRRNNLMTN